MRRHIIVLPALLLLFNILVPEAFAMSRTEEVAGIYHPTVTEVVGVVSIKGNKYTAWEEAREGMLLLTGDTLRTGKDSRARISFPSGELEIYETTIVVIPDIDVKERKKDIKEVFVEEGKTLFSINPLGVERGFQFRTRDILGGVKGTIFSVSYVEDGTSVNVYRGVVEVSDLKESQHEEVILTAGKSLRVAGRAGLEEIKDFDPTQALENYRKNIPPGLSDKGLPADSNANISNKGVRKRGNKDAVSPDADSDSHKDDNNEDDQGEDEK
jgi:hypothetical protein